MTTKSASERGFIPAVEARYIQLLLEDRDAENKKNGLQRLCRFYRQGLTLRYPHPIRQTLNGMLHTQSAKVRRWTLNAIALVGRRSDNLDAVLQVLERNRSDPETIVSAIPALFALCDPSEVISLIQSRDIPLEGAFLLAAAQHSEKHRVGLTKNRVNVDIAGSLELRMATLLVGMGKAPEHLFDQNHENRVFIGQLNKHSDDLVAQYSVWAITENNTLNLNDLSLSLQDIESFPPNVRAWIYRLIASDNDAACDNREYIVVGSEDTSEEAREGLATGLREIFFDGLEETVFRWLPDESSMTIRHRLLEHMASCADRCQNYEACVTEEYRQAGSLLRARLEAAAKGKNTYAELRRIAIINEQVELGFNRQTEININMTQQNINTGGGNIGAVTNRGNVIAQSIEAVDKSNAEADIKEILREVLDFADRNLVGLEEAKSAAKVVEETANRPSKSTFGKLLRWLKNVKEGTSYVGSASDSLVRLMERVSQVKDMIN